MSSPLSPKQEKILEHLLGHATGCTVEDLCSVLDLTKTAVKGHVDRLEAWGYLHFEDRKGFIGRPRRFYLLTNKGTEAFPRQYSWLSNTLLEHLTETMSSIQIKKLLHDLAKKTAAPLMETLNSKKQDERLALVGKVMNDLGYKAKIKPENKQKETVIQAMNCVYHSVAIEHPELCEFDIRFLTETTMMDVRLDSCIAKGGSCCSFTLKKRI